MRQFEVKLVCFSILFLAVFPSSGNEWRVFTGENGTSVEARIEKVNTQAGKVTVTLRNKKRVTALISSFSQQDQIFIKEWNDAQIFLSESNLKISIRRLNGEAANYGSKTGLEKQVKTAYKFEIIFQNKTASAIENLSAEYGVYLRTESKSKSTLTFEPKKIEIFSISGSGGKVFITDSTTPFEHVLVTYMKDLSSGEVVRFSEKKIYEDFIDGICVRLYLNTESENQFVKEVYYPESLSKRYEWEQVKENEEKGSEEKGSEKEKGSDPVI